MEAKRVEPLAGESFQILIDTSVIEHFFRVDSFKGRAIPSAVSLCLFEQGMERRTDGNNGKNRHNWLDQFMREPADNPNSLSPLSTKEGEGIWAPCHAFMYL
jgi:hypothetical protein